MSQDKQEVEMSITEKLVKKDLDELDKNAQEIKELGSQIAHDYEILVNTILETKNKEIEDARSQVKEELREKIEGMKRKIIISGNAMDDALNVVPDEEYNQALQDILNLIK